ncbi:MAG: hypothetical protein MZW92_01750 [Comamonadaceae bacterium]|nr:hypothetical protein [Comamonadaceae bacterium]
MRSREPTRDLGPGQWLLVGAVVLYLGTILILPLSAIFTHALQAGLGPLLHAFDDPVARHGLWLSLVLAGIALLANGALGVAGALVLTRQRFLGRRVLDALVDLPLAVSPVMTGLAFLLVFGREGWLEPALEAGGWKVTFAFPGLVLATLFVTFPFTLREVGYVLEELGTEEEEAAATLGRLGLADLLAGNAAQHPLRPRLRRHPHDRPGARRVRRGAGAGRRDLGPHPDRDHLHLQRPRGAPGAGRLQRRPGPGAGQRPPARRPRVAQAPVAARRCDHEHPRDQPDQAL